MKTKIIVLGMVLLLFSYPTILRFGTSPNENYLQAAKETTKPNTNFMFASNASLLGRIYMTFSGKDFLPCINTATSFFNKYHTCSNCEDFEKNPEKWNFERTAKPEVGDIIIQHDPQTGRAYHAALIVRIENERYFQKSYKFNKNLVILGRLIQRYGKNMEMVRQEG